MFARHINTVVLAAVIAALFSSGPRARAQVPASEVLEPTGGSEFDVIATVQAEPQWTAGARFEVKIDDQNPERGYLVRVEKGRATVLKRSGGKTEPIGVSGAVSFPAGAEHELSVKRRETRLLVLVDGRIAASASDHAYGGGEVSYSIAGEGLSFSKVRYQPIENIYFADDFVRTGDREDILGPWEATLGSWRSTFTQVPSRSANAFWMLGQAEGVALATAGYDFWDDYSIQAAVRPTTNCRAVGLAFYCRDANNYVAFRWTANRPEEQGKREIIEVADGETKVLASAPGGFNPSEYQWYRLRVNVNEHVAVALVDGIPVVYAPLDGPGEGKVGLYAVGSEGTYFDDVLVRSYRAVYEDFHPATFAAWERKGDWSLVDDAPRSEKAAGEASAFYGLPHWSDYTYMVDLLTGNGHPVGVYFNREDADDYYLYRSSSAGQELVRVTNGRSQTVDRNQKPLDANHWHALQIESRDGYVRVSADGEAVVEDYNDGPAAGGIGLYAGDKCVAKFRQVRVYFVEEAAPDERVPERFAVDPHMREWATRAGDWLNPNPAAPGEFWRRGDFYGDVSVDFLIEEIREQVGSATVALAADGDTFASGYRVMVVHPRDADYVTAQLYRGTDLVREAKGALPAEGETTLTTRVERRGKFIAVTIEDEPVVRYADPQPLSGSRVGFTTDALYARVNDVVVTGDHQFEHTFNVAPVNWVIRGGVWGIQPRYGCDPRWSFFGGYDHGIASVWHKQPVKGDVTFDIYAGIKMEPPQGYEDYAQRWRDVNITICADGEHVNSGYTLIYGGWHNKHTRLLRGNEIVASTDDVLMPNKDQAHREWLHLTLERKGQHVVASIGNRQVLEYTDPNPLPGEHCAIWTRDNGIMIARANLYYQQADPPQHPSPGYSSPGLPARTPARYPLAVSSSTHPTIANDFEVSAGQVTPRDSTMAAAVGIVDAQPAGGSYCLEAINAYPAADFALNLRSTMFDAARLAKLSFDYRFPKGAPIDLYLRTGDRQTYAILMTGKESDDYTVIGKVAGAVADGNWHRAEVDLAQCLKPKLGDPPYQVRSLWLASRSADPDVEWYGFGEIPGGSKLYLDNFALRGAGERTVEFEWSALPEADSPSSSTSIPAEVLEELRRGGVMLEGAVDDAVVVNDVAAAAEVPAAAVRVLRVRRGGGLDREGDVAMEVEMPAELVDLEAIAPEVIFSDPVKPPDPPVEIVGYSYLFDRNPDTEAPQESRGAETSATFTADRAGLWYLHVRAKAKDGTWGDTCHLGVLVE